MTDIGVVLSTIEKIRAHCDTLDKLRAQQAETYKNETAALKEMSASLTKQMREKYDKYKENSIGRIDKELKALLALLSKDYAKEVSDAADNREAHLKQTEAEAQESLSALLEQINQAVKELNELNFDQLVPPHRIEVNGESFTVSNGSESKAYDYRATKREQSDTPRPLVKKVSALASLCKEAQACLRVISIWVDRRFDIRQFTSHVDSCNATRLDELAISQKNTYEARYNALFVDEQADAVPKSFLTTLQEEGKVCDIDPTAIPDSYRQSMTLGDLRLLVDQTPEHLSYIRNSPSIGKFLGDGRMSAPLIMDLKKCGNILLNVNEDVYSAKTEAFVNQVIMQFLLSFPANRINFCLVDIENRMGLSPYKSLTKINTGILLSGIVRDDRQLENTIKDMEQTMYKIDDDILSYNNVPDIFEYNRRYEANPQSMHLFVLVNYPSGMRDDMAKRVSKILQSGNKAGIFCLIINNNATAPSPNLKPSEHQQFLEAAKKHSIVLDRIPEGFKLAVEHDNVFVPRDSLRIENLPDIVDNLRVEGEKKRQTVIPLDMMFGDTDKALASARGIPSSAEVLDIPLGARGGEIQNLLLKTTGDGSAHAVVIGGTGSGKSNLLHAIILSACYKYSPEELNLYIVDFKGGVEFEYYEAGKVRKNQIPHIKLTGLTSDLEDGVSILANLHKELRRREEDFKRNQVEDICQYRALGKKIPRLFVIIDEIQELFEQDDRLGQKAIDILRELFKKGRAFGINILWASQNVPKTPGLKDKVLSQIGNRISLRLNEPDDALDIKIDPKVVKNLNRPEKGLGVINDIRYGNDAVEFRVAYAESSVNRVKYSQMIIDKWRNVAEQMDAEPLYIVGDDAEPSPMEANTIYSAMPERSQVVSKAFESYTLQLGQDYVTGKPFDVNLPLMENKMNLLMVGHDPEVLRDMMGYSLLSVLINQMTNADCLGKGTKIHYASDLITQKNAGDLFYVLRDDFAPLLHNVSTPAAFADCIRDVYRLYKERIMEAENAEIATAHAPEFVVIHSLQRYVDLLNQDPELRLREDTATAAPAAMEAPSSGMSKLDEALFQFDFAKAAPAPAAESADIKGMPETIRLSKALKELLDRGGKQNIHFVISVDDPLAIGSIKSELISAAYKVFVKGVSNNVLTQMLGDYKAANSLTNSKVAMVCWQDERTKVRMYRYDSEKDQNWYQELCAKYRPLMEDMQ